MAASTYTENMSREILLLYLVCHLTPGKWQSPKQGAIHAQNFSEPALTQRALQAQELRMGSETPGLGWGLDVQILLPPLSPELSHPGPSFTC